MPQCALELFCATSMSSDGASYTVALPFSGPWLVATSPATKVPSHGTTFLGQTFAVDFVAVDENLARSARVRDWRSLLWFEPPERFLGFGAPVLAPAGGTIVAAHDGEPDHVAYRSALALVTFGVRQWKSRTRDVTSLVGNHIIIALDERLFALLAHLRCGSVRVRPGENVHCGQVIAACGNSGNSTEPHLHFQLMDSTDLWHAAGRPVIFRDYETRINMSGWREVEKGLPASGDIVRSLSAARR
jgi:peptidase M23-like protein